MDTPLVSAVIPVCNGERYLAEAIESVLSQTYRNLELIVVDDGSTDGSAAVARRYEPRVRICSQPNRGTGAARNQGLQVAQGAFFAHLDADDLWLPEALARRMDALAAQPDMDIVSGHVQQFYSPETDASFRHRIYCPPETIPGHVPGAMVVRRAAFFRVGWFETTWQIGNDMSWYLRAAEAGLAIRVLPEVVLRRRLHERNEGILKRHLMNERIRILKASLERRRAAMPDAGKEPPPDARA